MYEISKEIEFDAGHRVPLHESKCKNPHGHRYRVVATVEGELITSGPESGMVRDFSVVKELLTKHVHDVYDHGFIAYEEDKWAARAFGVEEAFDGDVQFKFIPVPFYPTAECLAKAIYYTLKDNGLAALKRIDVWETPTSCASYVEETYNG